MSSSFMELNGRGLWCSDGAFAVWSYCMRELLADAPDGEWRSYREHLWVQATVNMPGCKGLEVDQLSEGARRELALLADRLPEWLAEHRQILTATELNRLALGGPDVRWLDDIPAKDISTLSRLIAGVLRGEIGWDPGAPEAMRWFQNEVDAGPTPGA